ncbi:hypothetical protein DINM_021005 [Dirofilaria immitis]|nr:hypothetical protein [Dirofilaria immitis]
MPPDEVKCLLENFYERLFESNLIEGIRCNPNMPLYGARLVYSGYISCRNLSSLPVTFKSPKLINRVISYIDDVTGATEIREAHITLKQYLVFRCDLNWRLVYSVEGAVENAQVLRRKKRDELDALQIRMKQIHSELDRFSRGDDKYLRLLTEEHAVIKSEQLLIAEVKRRMKLKKQHLMNCQVRFGLIMRKNRSRMVCFRSSRVKTWTVIASTLGALFGIIGAWVANEVRMHSALLTSLVKEITALVEKQQNEVAAFIMDIREVMHLKAAEGIAIEQNKTLKKELDAIKRLVAIELNLKAETPNVVYIGSDMEDLLSKSEKILNPK